MKYKLKIRKFNDSDIAVECPTFPEENDFELYLHALKEDIENINQAKSVELQDQQVIVEVNSEEDFATLHTKVKDLLTGSYWCRLRTEGGFARVQKDA